jgi:hypothetical protein
VTVSNDYGLNSGGQLSTKRTIISQLKWAFMEFDIWKLKGNILLSIPHHV